MYCHDESTEQRLSTAHPSPVDILAFLPYAVNQLQQPFRLQLIAEVQEAYVSKAEEKSKKISKAKSTAQAHPTNGSQEPDDQSDALKQDTSTESDEIVITAVFDSTGRLIELNFTRCREIPRMLMKIIGLCVPYHTFLTKLTIRYGPLKGESLYEIAKFMPCSYLTDICLDDSPVREKNYCLLLEHEHLKRLSLGRCCIDDSDCAIIAAKLVHPLPAAKNLQILSLVSNAIADVGACALANMLRSNRTLQYLNLSGNRLTDTGALSIFRSLIEFPLTYNELIMKRQRFIEHQRLRKEVYNQCMGELTATLERSTDDRGVKRKTMTPGRSARKGSATAMSIGTGTAMSDPFALKVEMLVNELVGAYHDPFGTEDTVSRDAYVYSVGNLALCWLNLSYNQLEYVSVAGLLRVLEYQSTVTRRSGGGLMRVLIEGNVLPVACIEYVAIQEHLDNALQSKLAKPSKLKSDKIKPKGK